MADYTLDFTASEINEQLSKLSATDDYIVEQETNGIWTYRKWNSGIAECWGTANPTSDASGAEGGLYFQSVHVDFPNGLFVSAPSVTVAAHGNWIGGVLTGNGLTKDKWHGYRWTSTSQTNTSVLRIELIAKGRWK